MVKEFEQQHDQDIAVLLDPWLPRNRPTAAQRENLEASISFAATVCLEICRRQGRRLLLGWAENAPVVRKGPASIRLLHEMLAQLAVLHGTDTGRLALLFDAMPPQVLREAMLVIVSTRPVSLTEEAEKSHRLHGDGGRGLANRVMLLDAANGDLDGLIQFNGQPRQNVAGGAPKSSDVGPDGAIQNPGNGPDQTNDARDLVSPEGGEGSAP